MPKVSIIIPLYNEQSYIERCLHEVCSQKFTGWEREIIVIDDGSTDDSSQIVSTYSYLPEVLLYSHPTNQGKGAAIQSALRRVTGDVVIIQDADLEYDPRDILTILKRYEDSAVGAVYGSRILGEKEYHTYASNVLFYTGGRVLTRFMNLLFGTSLTDQATCYKSWRSRYNEDILRHCKRPGFEYEIELTARLNMLTPIVEVPIHYYPRTVSHGKKIRFADFLKSVYVALIWRLSYSLPQRA